MNNHIVLNGRLIARKGTGYMDKVQRDGSFIRYDNNGDISYYNNDNQLHREDGPAIMSRNGMKEWYKHGKLHRTDGPAVIYLYSGVHEEWWVDGKPIVPPQ